jgi:chaperonin GroES
MHQIAEPSAGPLINFRPRRDRVVVKDVPAPPPPEGTLTIPDSQKKPPLEGQVLAVGDGVDDLEPGMIVLFGEFTGTETYVDGELLRFLRDEEVIGQRLPAKE